MVICHILVDTDKTIVNTFLPWDNSLKNTRIWRSDFPVLKFPSHVASLINRNLDKSLQTAWPVEDLTQRENCYAAVAISFYDNPWALSEISVSKSNLDTFFWYFWALRINTSSKR